MSTQLKLLHIAFFSSTFQVAKTENEQQQKDSSGSKKKKPMPQPRKNIPGRENDSPPHMQAPPPPSHGATGGYHPAGGGEDETDSLLPKSPQDKGKQPANGKVELRVKPPPKYDHVAQGNLPPETDEHSAPPTYSVVMTGFNPNKDDRSTDC